MLLLGEGSEVTEPYNKYEAFFRTCATQIHFRTCATQIHFRTCATQIYFRTCATQIPKFILGLVNSRHN